MPPDDLMDILELADQIQVEVSKLLQDQQMDVAVSALMAALVNMVSSQRPTRNQMIAYRNILFNLFNQMIKKSPREEQEHS